MLVIIYDDVMSPALHQVDLNLLVAFEALMAERNVTAAADRLSIGQPAMSATLSRLRKLFDDPLLVRVGRSMQPTAYAESLVEPVGRALDQIRTVLVGREHFDPQNDRQVFSVMASHHAAVAIVHPLMLRLATEAPHAKLSLVPVAGDFIHKLRTNKVDVVIVPPEVVPTEPDLARLDLYEDRYVVALDRNHPTIGDSISLDEFSAHPYLASTYENARALADLQLDSLGVTRRVEVVTSFGVAPYLLRGTSLITLIPERYGRRIATGAGIKLLEPPVPLHPVTESLVWSRTRAAEASLGWLRDTLKSLAQRLPESG